MLHTSARDQRVCTIGASVAAPCYPSRGHSWARLYRHCLVLDVVSWRARGDRKWRAIRMSFHSYELLGVCRITTRVSYAVLHAAAQGASSTFYA